MHIFTIECQYLENIIPIWKLLELFTFILLILCIHVAVIELPRRHSSKKSTCQCWRCRFDPWVRKIPWSWEWQPTPVFLNEKPHGQRSQIGNSTRVTRVRCDWTHVHVTRHAHGCNTQLLLYTLSNKLLNQKSWVFLHFSIHFLDI